MLKDIQGCTQQPALLWKSIQIIAQTRADLLNSKVFYMYNTVLYLGYLSSGCDAVRSRSNDLL